jgi:hypothetical protein
MLNWIDPSLFLTKMPFESASKKMSSTFKDIASSKVIFDRKRGPTSRDKNTDRLQSLGEFQRIGVVKTRGKSSAFSICGLDLLLAAMREI